MAEPINPSPATSLAAAAHQVGVANAEAVRRDRLLVRGLILDAIRRGREQIDWLEIALRKLRDAEPPAGG